MSTVLILYGPKAVGKSQIAHVLAEHLRVYHLDPDELIPRLLAAGKQPDPQDGWLAEVAAHVQDALANYDLVSVEATGAWESDWRLAHELEAGELASVACGSPRRKMWHFGDCRPERRRAYPSLWMRPAGSTTRRPTVRPAPPSTSGLTVVSASIPSM